MTDRTTLRDVATAAGVHASTASRALNPATRGVVSPETIERVIQAAERLGYRPDPLARGLRTNQTLTVGMVVPDLENPLFPPIVRGAEAALGREGYSLLVGNTDNDLEHTEAVVSTLAARRVDGLLLATAQRNDEMIAGLVSEGIPVVLVNRETEHPRVPAIIGDDRIGIGLAVTHLVELGHNVIGHVAGPQSLSTGVGRANAFRHWMGELGQRWAPELVEEAEWFRFEPGRVAAARLIERVDGLTAIVAANDLLALGAYDAVRATGRTIPGDISVVGYNDMPFVDHMDPALTTVCVPYREMGVRAAETLLELMVEGGTGTTKTTRLAPALSVRSSAAPPR